MAIQSKTNFSSGLLFAAFGLAALFFGRHYNVGTASEMGPGYFPRVLGLALLVLGAGISVRALYQRGAQAQPIHLKPLLLLISSVVVFALLIDRAGVAVAGVVLVAGCRLAAPGFRLREVVWLAVGLTAAAVLIFGYGLGIPFLIWPEFN